VSATDRFALWVALRAQVSDRELQRRYLAVEAIMEALAPAAGVDVEHARLAGLGAMADAQLCRHNPERRGEVAEEYLLTEGVPPEVASAVRWCYREDFVDKLSDLACLLAAAEGIADFVHAELAHTPLDDIRPGSPDPRAAECLDRLGLDPLAAVATALSAMRAIRADLRLR
jgi:predicted hydrolase (HD superfamily)